MIELSVPAAAAAPPGEPGLPVLSGRSTGRDTTRRLIDIVVTVAIGRAVGDAAEAAAGEPGVGKAPALGLRLGGDPGTA
jgi:hypothetical protein